MNLYLTIEITCYNLGDKPRCTVNEKCDDGEGICKTDDECEIGLICGTRNCVGEPGKPLDPWNNCCKKNSSEYFGYGFNKT